MRKVRVHRIAIAAGLVAAAATHAAGLVAAAATHGAATYAATNDDDIRIRPQETVLPERVELAFEPDVVPPTIEGSINGQGPFRIAIDTGARISKIDDDIAKKLGLDSPRRVVVSTGTDGEAEASVVALASVQIGSVALKDFDVAIIDYDQVYDGERKRDLTLGFPAFIKILLTLDYPESRIVLQDGELPMDNDRDILMYDDETDVPKLSMRFQALPLNVTIDTGRAGTFTIPEQHKDRVKLAFGDSAKHISGVETPLAEIREIPAEGTVRLGQYALVEPLFHYFGAEAAMGYNVLKYFRVSFDQRYDRVRLARVDTDPIRFVPPPKFGLIVKWQNARYRIVEVIPGSPAAKIALRPGDIVTAVNNRSIYEYDEYTLRQLFDRSDSVVLRVERHGLPMLLRLDAPEEDTTGNNH